MENQQKIVSKNYPNVSLKVIPGHFVTPNSHINYYVDMTTLKTRQSEATEVARAMVEKYISTTIVDTIICMDGCEVIGAYLAEQLTRAGIMSMNAHETIYIVTPEFNTSGQIIFRENTQPMIRGKNVLLLLATATTGKTVARALDAIHYYNGNIVGVSAIFSAASKVYNVPINAIFTTADIPDYRTYLPESCSLCKDGKTVDAIANGFGYSRL